MKKNLMTVFFVALTVLVNLPVTAMANAAPIIEATGIITAASYKSSEHRIYGNDVDNFNVFLNRGHVDILIIGDGSSDLDLYIYDANGLAGKSQANSDDEKVCLSNIIKSGYFKIKVVNRGNYANDYRLIIK